jgi:adenosine kinase
MGNPLLDISANVNQDILDKYGLKLNNAILAEEKHLPIYKELVEKYPVEYIAGGATQNSIRICQWMMQKPNATAYVGSVGNDEFGSILAQRATAEGVAVYYHIAKDLPTGTCAVLVQHHERSLVANLAAANSYDHAHLLKPETEAVWKQAQIIYIAGFFLTVSPPSIMHLARFAAANQKTFIMNLAAPFISDFFMEPLSAALPYCDIVIGNGLNPLFLLEPENSHCIENESAAYAKACNFADHSPEAVAHAIAAIPFASPSKKDRIVIITQGLAKWKTIRFLCQQTNHHATGSHPTIVVEKGKLTKYDVPEVDEKELVDLNGAGDAFVGGLLAYLAQGKSLATTIAAGHYCAGVVIRRPGCTVQGKPNFKE